MNLMGKEEGEKKVNVEAQASLIINIQSKRLLIGNASESYKENNFQDYDRKYPDLIKPPIPFDEASQKSNDVASCIPATMLRHKSFIHLN